MSQKKKISLALQGGGSHGAIAWGVLDKILQDERLEIVGVSGTSAGAVNAAVMVHGIALGGFERARKNLELFWKAISKAGQYSPVQRNFWDKMIGNWGLDHSPVYLALDMLSRSLSPYELNPMDLNPLLSLLEDKIDFEVINNYKKIKLFISATDVNECLPHVFTQPCISAKSVMASAAVPTMYQAVEIDGKYFWDGGYMGNPCMYPLVDEVTDTKDIILVQINPFKRDEVPKNSRDILNRLTEITFNASLIKELRSIMLLNEVINYSDNEQENTRETFLHSINADEDLQHLTPSSKLNTEWEYLTYLRDLGRRHAEIWINSNFDKLGKESSMDLSRISRCSVRSCIIKDKKVQKEKEKK